MTKTTSAIFAQKGITTTFSGAIEYKRPKSAKKSRSINPGAKKTHVRSKSERALHNATHKLGENGGKKQFLCPFCRHGYLGRIVDRVAVGCNRVVRTRECNHCNTTVFTEEIILKSLYDKEFANRMEWIAVTATQDVRRAKQLLHNQPSLLDAQDSKGNTALVRAILSKSYDMFYFLLNNGCSILTKNKNQDNAIDIAEQLADKSYLKALLIKKTYGS